MMYNLIGSSNVPLNVNMAIPYSNFSALLKNGNDLNLYAIESGFPRYLSVIIGVLLWSQFLLLGITGIYMRQVFKINTAIFLKDLSKWNLIIGVTLLILQFIFGLIFIGGINVSPANEVLATLIKNSTRPTYIALEFCFITI
jgi:hypothetical protein